MTTKVGLSWRCPGCQDEGNSFPYQNSHLNDYWTLSTGDTTTLQQSRFHNVKYRIQLESLHSCHGNSSWCYNGVKSDTKALCYDGKCADGSTVGTTTLEEDIALIAGIVVINFM